MPHALKHSHDSPDARRHGHVDFIRRLLTQHARTVRSSGQVQIRHDGIVNNVRPCVPQLRRPRCVKPLAMAPIPPSVNHISCRALGRKRQANLAILCQSHASACARPGLPAQVRELRDIAAFCIGEIPLSNFCLSRRMHTAQSANMWPKIFSANCRG